MKELGHLIFEPASYNLATIFKVSFLIKSIPAHLYLSSNLSYEKDNPFKSANRIWQKEKKGHFHKSRSRL
jgi:hypothetical protein